MVAGGTGTRMDSAIAKQFILVNGKPVIVHCFEKFYASEVGYGYALVLHESLHPEWQKVQQDFLPWLDKNNFILCGGGAERSDSVANGLQMIANHNWAADTTLIAIHDAVRPLVTCKIILDAFQLAEEKGSAVVCVPVKSSLRIKTQTGSKAVDRDMYFHVQTPQVFRMKDLSNWYQQRPAQLFTDDASLAEFFGCEIQISEGSYDNLKITTPEDLAVAEILLKKENEGG